jgi:hypothetical protein
LQRRHIEVAVAQGEVETPPPASAARESGVNYKSLISVHKGCRLKRVGSLLHMAEVSTAKPVELFRRQSEQLSY